MIVVSNTSPIINLAMIGRLTVLEQLYRQIFIPRAVYDEVVIAGHGKPGSLEVSTQSWFDMRDVSDRLKVARLRSWLDAGEAEAIALAVELGADVVLIDEYRGRVVAREQGLAVTGLVGVIIAAKANGLLPSVKPVLDALRTTAGFRLSDRLYAYALASAGESI